LLGVNLGKNKASEDAVEDYVQGVRAFGNLADYLVINVSSPNTPGLTQMQFGDELNTLLAKVRKAVDALDHPPALVLKISPDCTEKQLVDISRSALQHKLDGMIVANTTVSRPSSLTKTWQVSETGGLSGPPLRQRTLQCLKTVYKATEGKIPLIASGGVSSAQDAIDYARAGATLVQVYTGLIYNGPGLVSEIKQGILRQLDTTTWQDIIGKDA
jgi:dihydroorotate dehydrogenase